MGGGKSLGFSWVVFLWVSCGGFVVVLGVFLGFSAVEMWLWVNKMPPPGKTTGCRSGLFFLLLIGFYVYPFLTHTHVFKVGGFNSLN